LTNIKTNSLHRINKVHFIGIGGVGMSGIAEVMFNIGYNVSGSDLAKNAHTQRLLDMGVKIAYKHAAENVADVDAVVLSSAVDENNVELKAARERKIPIVPRAEMLAELMRFKQGIAVAGTHGKTTTTSLISMIFALADLDPTYVIGGKVNSVGSNAKLGNGKYFIAEADESDASFLHLSPFISVVTNIDNDHLQTYKHDMQILKQAYVNFIHNIPFYGLGIVCIDDLNVRSILLDIHRPILTYGFSNDADVKILSWTPKDRKTNFTIQLPNKEIHSFTLNLMGQHNVLNACAAIMVALEADIAIDTIKLALANFQGVGRRLQVLGERMVNNKSFTLIDDYGHHPTELASVIAAIKSNWPHRRLFMIFQPHRYTRTHDLFEDFCKVLSQVDTLFLLNVYSAGEKEIIGADSKSLCSHIRAIGLVDPIFINDHAELLTILPNILRDQDILLTQGAGDVSKVAALLMQEFVCLA
jgi:UDP-N-acetylmuramate--alanine ligase